MATAYYLNQYITTTLSVAGGITDSATTGIVIASTDSIECSKPGIALLSYADPLSTTTAEWITYTGINSSTKAFEGVTRGAEGFAAKAHDNGAAIAFPLSKSHINNLNSAVEIGGSATNILQGVLDEDDMASDSAVKGATQQSIKAYIKAYADNHANKSMYDNAIINGNFDVWQRGTSFTASANNDDVFTADRWNLISDGNDAVDVSQEAVTDLAGSSYAIKLDTETAKRYGIVQFIEAKDAQKFKGQTVSLSFKVKSANISALRATVLSWASTADSVTSDIVASWADTPTWATNWADNATPADLTVTSDWTTVKVEGIVLDEATVNNLALVIWTPNEETIGDIVYIAQVKLELGDTATTYQPRSFAEELRACQRYCYGMTTTSGTQHIAHGHANKTTEAYFDLHIPVTMRTSPTLTATATDWQIADETNAGIDCSELAFAYFCTNTVALKATVSGATQYRPYFLRGDTTSGRVLILSAEL